MSSPPKTYQEFIAASPSLGEAWESLRRGEQEAGPLDAKAMRLVKLGIAAGAMREAPEGLTLYPTCRHRAI